MSAGLTQAGNGAARACIWFYRKADPCYSASLPEHVDKWSDLIFFTIRRSILLPKGKAVRRKAVRNYLMRNCSSITNRSREKGSPHSKRNAVLIIP